MPVRNERVPGRLCFFLEIRSFGISQDIAAKGRLPASLLNDPKKRKCITECVDFLPNVWYCGCIEFDSSSENRNAIKEVNHYVYGRTSAADRGNDPHKREDHNRGDHGDLWDIRRIRPSGFAPAGTEGLLQENSRRRDPASAGQRPPACGSGFRNDARF